MVIARERSYSAARLATDCGETERMGTRSCAVKRKEASSQFLRRVTQGRIERTGCSLRTRYTSSCDWSETSTDSADVMQPLCDTVTRIVSMLDM